jgi:DNA gyrase/topoisomerase IV subunit A
MSGNIDYDLRQSVMDRFHKVDRFYDCLVMRIHEIEKILKNVDDDENVESVLTEKIGNLIERMVIVEDSVQRLQKGEQIDEQGYTWNFSPEDLMQRVAYLETELARIAGKIGCDIEKPVNIRRPYEKHLEKIIQEKNDRIKKLEEIINQVNDRFAQPIKNHDLVIEMQKYL